jgi:hypothetical protein
MPANSATGNDTAPQGRRRTPIAPTTAVAVIACTIAATHPSNGEMAWDEARRVRQPVARLRPVLSVSLDDDHPAPVRH